MRLLNNKLLHKNISFLRQCNIFFKFLYKILVKRSDDLLRVFEKMLFCFFVLQSSGITFVRMSARNYASLMNQNYSSCSLINVGDVLHANDSCETFLA